MGKTFMASAIRGVLVALVAGLAGAAVQAEEPTTTRLDEVVVEGQRPGDFDDVEAWDREVRDALDRAKLKQRDELTEHDQQQILVLQQEMPILKKNLDKIQKLVRAHKFRQTLSMHETQELADSYKKVEAILENIPDAMMPKCRKVHGGGRRNKTTTCEVDYFAIERQLDELRRKQGEAGTQRIASHGGAAPVIAGKDQPFFKVTSPPKAETAQRVHVLADEFRLEQVRVAFAGDVMTTREDFHAVATKLPELRPAHAFRLELPTGTGMSLTNADKLGVVGWVKNGDEKLRVIALPRAAAVGYGIVVNNDNTIEGTLVAYDYAPTARRRMSPVNGLRAAVVPADTRLLQQYTFEETIDDKPFVRYDVVFDGVNDGRVGFIVRRYDQPAPSDPVGEERAEFAAQPGVVQVGGLDVEIRELETGRLKYTVNAASPAMTIAKQ
jgi:hypothetical protein